MCKQRFAHIDLGTAFVPMCVALTLPSPLEILQTCRVKVLAASTSDIQLMSEVSHISRVDRFKHRDDLVCFATLIVGFVQSMSGLEDAPQLRRLYLYSNSISKIEYVEHMTDLQSLWLNDNQITVIEVSITVTLVQWKSNNSCRG